MRFLSTYTFKNWANSHSPESTEALSVRYTEVGNLRNRALRILDRTVTRTAQVYVVATWPDLSLGCISM